MPGAIAPPLQRLQPNRSKFLCHTDFHRTQKLTSSKRKTIQNRPWIDPEMLAFHSIKPFTDKIFTNLTHWCDPNWYYYTGSEWTWELWQWNGTPYFPDLQNWSLAIKCSLTSNAGISYPSTGDTISALLTGLG